MFCKIWLTVTAKYVFQGWLKDRQNQMEMRASFSGKCRDLFCTRTTLSLRISHCSHYSPNRKAILFMYLCIYLYFFTIRFLCFGMPLFFFAAFMHIFRTLLLQHCTYIKYDTWSHCFSSAYVHIACMFACLHVYFASCFLVPAHKSSCNGLGVGLPQSTSREA